MVSLKEAWDSGAWAWNDQQRANFANDLGDRRALRAVTAASNQQKGDKDPSNWLPTDQSSVCRYVADWWRSSPAGSWQWTSPSGDESRTC